MHFQFLLNRHRVDSSLMSRRISDATRTFTMIWECIFGNLARVPAEMQKAVIKLAFENVPKHRLSCASLTELQKML